MKVSLLDIYRPGDNRDYNGGYGTTFNIGKTFLSKTLAWARKKNEYFPLLNYGYLSAVLKQNGHDVTLDINKINEEADLVILHASLIRHNEEIETLKKIRETTKAKTCLVGPLVSTNPERFLEVADTILQNDAEKVLLDLHTLEDLPEGLFDAGKLEDLDILPFPDWSIYDYQKFTQYPILHNKPTAFIQGSRSCPYKCNYCPYIVNPNSYRIRKVENVIEELKHLRDKYGVKAVTFRDPTFSLNRKWVVQLCDAIKSEGIELEFACETRTDRLDIELLDLMYEAGFRAIKIGVESTDHESLKTYERLAPALEHQEKIVQHAESLGIRIIAFYILGLPDDTIETMEQTIKYSTHLNSSLANFTICTPIPGTGFYNEMKDRIYDHDWNHYDNFHPVFKTNHVSGETIKDYQEKALVNYYWRFDFFKNLISSKLIKK